MKYKIENAFEEDKLDDKYIKALKEKGFCVDEHDTIEINTLEDFIEVIEILERVNNFMSFLDYNGVIIHGNTLTIHDCFIY